jgi:hypothetical protein
MGKTTGILDNDSLAVIPLGVLNPGGLMIDHGVWTETCTHPL